MSTLNWIPTIDLPFLCFPCECSNVLQCMSQVTWIFAEIHSYPSQNSLNIHDIFRRASVPSLQTGYRKVLQNSFLGRQRHVNEGYTHSLHWLFWNLERAIKVFTYDFQFFHSERRTQKEGTQCQTHLSEGCVRTPCKWMQSTLYVRVAPWHLTAADLSRVVWNFLSARMKKW